MLVDRVNTTATVWLGSDARLRAVPQPQVRPVHAEGLLPAARRSSRTTTTTAGSFGDGTRYFEPTLDLATPEQETARKELQAEIDRLDQAAEDVDAGAARGAGDVGGVAARRRIAGGRRSRRGRRPPPTVWCCACMPDGSVLASGPNPPLTSYTVTGTHDRSRRSPACASRRCRIRRCRAAVPGATATATSASPACTSRPVAADGAADAGAGRLQDHEGGRFRDGVRAGRRARRQARPGMRGRAARGRSTRCATPERLPRNAVLAAAAPFGFASGTRLELPDRSSRRHHRSGHRPVPGLGHRSRRPARGRRPRAAAAAGAGAAGGRAHRRRRPTSSPRVFRATTPLLKETRDALAARRKALADLQDSVDADHAGARLVRAARRSSCACAAASRPRASASTPARRGRCTGCATICRSTGSVSPAGWSIRTTRSSRAWPSTGSGNSCSAAGWSRPAKTSARRGRRRRIPSCSTGSRPSSSPRAGARRRCSARSCSRPPTASRRRVPPALAERDPYNRLFARGPRVRLEAEMIRDATLAASGLLSAKMFGPSVFPLQPDGIWNMPYNSDKWTVSQGEDRYRRSLYTFWRRTSPYPSFMTFDATSREFCTVRRVRTNTPLQALTLLNDPASFEAARALARRMVVGGGARRPTRAALGRQAGAVAPGERRRGRAPGGALRQGARAVSPARRGRRRSSRRGRWSPTCC